MKKSAIALLHSKTGTLDAVLVEKAAKLVKQEEQHHLAKKNAKAVYNGQFDALKKSVGSLAVDYGLFRLTAEQLEGLFIAAATEISDPIRLAEWAGMGEAAKAQRADERAAKAIPTRVFHFGRSERQSEALEKTLRAHGFKAATGSARYWTMRSVLLPQEIIELARNNDERLWTYDEDGDRTPIFEPAADKVAIPINQLAGMPGYMSASANLDSEPANLSGSVPEEAAGADEMGKEA